MEIKIHAIQTGLVQIKTAQPVRRTGGLIRILLDSDWGDWLPIYTWVIEHPEGIIVVDTGETSKASGEGYFPAWHPYYRSVHMDVKPEDEVGPQLKKMGISTKDVKTLILTHFHTDHAGGLHHFPESEILVSGKDYKIAKGFIGRLLGYLPHRWPKWFDPTPIAFEHQNKGPFDRHFPVTNAGDVVVVPTPGHTPGHISVIVTSEDTNYLLAGDTTYSEQLLTDKISDGVSLRPSVTLGTIDKILKFAEMEPLVYLPSHDPQSAERLHKKQTIRHKALEFSH